jgi:hypothetical protein
MKGHLSRHSPRQVASGRDHKSIPPRLLVSCGILSEIVSGAQQFRSTASTEGCCAAQAAQSSSLSPPRSSAVGQSFKVKDTHTLEPENEQHGLLGHFQGEFIRCAASTCTRHDRLHNTPALKLARTFRNNTRRIKKKGRMTEREAMISAAQSGPGAMISAAQSGPGAMISAAQSGPGAMISAAQSGPGAMISAAQSGLAAMHCSACLG